ncbi:uncharacterized protein LOC117101090 [Anneissia japonica]|uniref:uncharacterized protein LOC117101090 n=1 Tax=Anneissia japonica TaxID=1529436 RepID=UPI0014259F45|nr:uncharacterized protein LOC117101090 [Anneissia japonica]
MDIRKTNTKIYPYTADTPIDFLGEFSTVVESTNKFVLANFLVVQRGPGPTTEYTTGVELGIVNITCSIPQKPMTDIAEKYADVFKGLGQMKNVTVKLHIDPAVQPVNQVHRRIPFHQRPIVELCIDKMLKDGVIEHAPGPHTWINPIILVPKSNTVIKHEWSWICEKPTKPLDANGT